jgi:hypothetical protein
MVVEVGKPMLGRLSGWLEKLNARVVEQRSLSNPNRR